MTERLRIVGPVNGQPASAGGGGGVTDHGALTGLGDDDHTIYALADGTRAFSGDIDLGTNAITNVGNVDGRDVSADGSTLDAHVASTSNPHSVTAAQAGADPSGTAASAVASHEAAGDPHPGYLLESAAGALALLDTVGSTEIDDAAVTNAKLADVATSTIKGRATASTGDVEDLTAAQVRTIINVADGATANTGALADLDTVGTAEIDDEAVTLAKMQHLTGPTILGRTIGTGDVTQLTADQALAITTASRGAHEVLVMSGTGGLLAPVALATDGFLGRNGLSAASSASCNAGNWLGHPNSGGGLAPYGRATVWADLCQGASGTSFPGSPIEGQQFYRTDLEAWFYYDSSRTKWLSTTDTISFSMGRNGSGTNVTLFAQNFALGGVGGKGIAVPYPATIVATAWQTGGTDTFTAEVRSYDHTSTNVEVSDSFSAVNRVQNLAANADVAAGDYIFGYANGSYTNNIMCTVVLKRRAT